MAQLAGDEKNDVVVNQPGALAQNKDVDVKETCTANVAIDNDKNELKLEVRHKRTKRLFKGIYTLDKLVKCGFNPQQSLKDIKSILQSAFNNGDGLTLTIG